MKNTKSIPLGDVLKFERFQVRSSENKATVRRYTEALRLGIKLPPLLATKIGDKVTIYDGLHRLAALQSAKQKKVKVTFTDVDSANLLQTALVANSGHGLPLTRSERKNAANKLLSGQPELSNRSIAKLVGVDEATVRRLRKEASNKSPNFVSPRDSFKTSIACISKSILSLGKKFPNHKQEIKAEILSALIRAFPPILNQIATDHEQH